MKKLVIALSILALVAFAGCGAVTTTEEGDAPAPAADTTVAE